MKTRPALRPGQHATGQVDRRTLLQASLAALVAGPATIAAASLTSVHVQLGWIANVEAATYWIAIDKGLFRNAGLDVTVFPGGPNAPDPLVMVAAGDAQLGVTSWLPFLDAVARGNDYVLFDAGLQQSPLGIISLKKRPILTPKDILGCRILAQGANEKTSIQATLALAGLNPDDWTMLPAGFSPEPLLSGEADGFTGFSTNEVITMEAMGLQRDRDFFFRSFYELGFKTYAALGFCTRSYLDANRPMIVRYVRALIEAARINELDPTYAAHLAVDRFGADYGLDPTQQIRQNQLQIPIIHPGMKPGFRLLTMDRRVMVTDMYAAARAAGRTHLPDIDRIVDFRIAEEAQA